MDTHALIFWRQNIEVSEEFISFFDEQAQSGNLYVSSITFWEIALLVKKGRIKINDVSAWRNDLLANASIKMVDPTDLEMIASVKLPDHHKDPFDRLLISQATKREMTIVTKDREFPNYSVSTLWID